MWEDRCVHTTAFGQIMKFDYNAKRDVKYLRRKTWCEEIVVYLKSLSGKSWDLIITQNVMLGKSIGKSIYRQL